MNDLEAIKEEIYNCGLVPQLLESIGCEVNYSTSSNDRVEARRPDGDNNRAVQVKLSEGLSAVVRSKMHIPIRDIFDLVSYIKYGKKTTEEFNQILGLSKQYIIKTLNLDNFKGDNVRTRNDPNAWLKKIQKKRNNQINLDEIEPNPILPESVLDQFVNEPHQIFVDDGITTVANKEFEIGFDVQTERITIPIRDKAGMLVGVKGRATKEEDMGNYKYLPIYAFQKSKELYNLHRSLPYIKRDKEIILFESEKSPIKAWQFGINNTVSQMGLDITKVQAEIVKRIMPDLKIILAYDKGIKVSEIKQMAKVFGMSSNVYAIYDKNDLLVGKNSPVDQTREIWEQLYNKYCFPVFP
ncbi:hypothetical protein [Paraliobacillus ryukyuensis]|uniref:hypothetical protein n=1 Tax=Paraliobacillus ryukyuensis TaxID=200904 RepID=UPI0009A6AD05|nr:hypothetical protein [Paraliobacillus ryukyuensis]